MRTNGSEVVHVIRWSFLSRVSAPIREAGYSWTAGSLEGGRYNANSLGICLDFSNAFMRVIRAAMSRSDTDVRSEDPLRVCFLLLLASWDFVRVTTEERLDVDEEEEEPDESDAFDEFPLTFLAHLVIASSSLAAMAPIRPPPKKEEEEEEEAEVMEMDEMEGTKSEVGSFGGSPL